MGRQVAYITRTLEPVVLRAGSEFPAVVVVGPRQSGKTTLLRHLYGDRFPMVSLELPDIRAAALADPRSFLDFNPPPVIFDEVQFAPELLLYIKERIDQRRDQPGQYFLTGSQNLLMMQQITESLAGRAAILTLLPLSHRELVGTPDRPVPWESAAQVTPGAALPIHELWQQILRGSFPEVAGNPQRDYRLWQASYVQTYLERDVRSLRNVGDLTLFQVFLRALAGRSAQLLNLSDLARDVGVAVNTVKAWLSILEASFQVFIVRPYYVNLGKRLVKTPKVYFGDTGLLSYLVGLRDPEHAATGPMAGALFETLVVTELWKAALHRGEEPGLYFWRTAAGEEVDLVVEHRPKLIPIEIKASATAHPGMAAAIARFRNDFGDKSAPGYVIYPGEQVLPLGGGTLALPYVAL